MRLNFVFKAAEVLSEVEERQAEGTREDVKILLAQALYNAYLNGFEEGRTLATFD